MNSKVGGPRIVLIDDDAHQAKFIIGGISLLVPGFAVEYVAKPDKVYARLEEGRWGDVVLFLVDVMMPPGKHYANEFTRNGEITGFFVARDIRQHLPHAPIVLWSTDPLNTIEKAAKQFVKTSIPNCIFTRKEDAVRKVLLCYQSIVDRKLPLDAGDSVSLERLMGWMKTLGPFALAAFKAWLKSRGSSPAGNGLF
jgi:CheY-like chemotaxis protein